MFIYIALFKSRIKYICIIYLVQDLKERVNLKWKIKILLQGM